MSEPKRDDRGRWRPGCSGNPRGRPRRGESLAELLRSVLAEKVEIEGGRRVTRARLVAETLVAKAIEGNVPAIRVVFERIEGKAPKCVRETHGQAHEASANETHQNHETTASVAGEEALEWVENLHFTEEDLKRLEREF